MTLVVGRREGPSTGMGSSMRRTDSDFALRPSVGNSAERLRKVLESYSQSTILDIARQIEKARERVGDDPIQIADLLEEGARARTDAGKALREGDVTIQQVAEVIRNSRKSVH